MSPISCSMSERIHWVDAWRGLALWLMLAYHLLFDFLCFGWMTWEQYNSVPMFLLERFIAYSFILCAGISARLSRSNIKRGVVTAGAGLLVVAVSFVIGMPILFGVLQFLSAAMLLDAVTGRWTDRVPTRLAPFLWAGLYAATLLWTNNTEVSTKWLFWLGFRYPDFESFDYFPMLPYLFLYLEGTWLGGIVRKHRDAPWMHQTMPAILTRPGQRTLIVYLLHQPVLFGICYIVYYALARGKP